MEFEMIAKTFRGLEEVLATELVNIGANNVQLQRRAVSFTGDKALMYKANLCSRTASRILKPRCPPAIGPSTTTASGTW